MLCSVRSAVRGNNQRVVKSLLSMSALSEEFPLKTAVNPTAPVAPVVTLSRLDNGAKIALSHQPGSTATVKIAVLGGSSVESLAEKGSAQLLSVSAFDGNINKSGLLISRELEEIGALVEAVADREKITYSLRVPNEHLSLALDLLVGVVKSPIHRQYIIEEAKERAQIFYDKMNACPTSRVTELLHEASYGENTPLGSSLLAADLHSLEASDVLHYRNSVFAADNLRVAVHGDLNNNKVADMLKDRLTHGVAVGTSRPLTSSLFSGGEVRQRVNLGGGATRAALSFPCSSAAATKPFEVLRQLLQSKGGSPLSHVQIHMHSKVHHHSSDGAWSKTFIKPYKAGGMFGVVVKGDAHSVSSSLQSFITSLKAIANGDVTPEELAVAKNTLRLNALLEGQGEALYRTLLADSETPFSETDLSSVSKEAVVSAAKASLKASPGYAVYGATYQVPNLNAVTKWLA